MQYGPANEVSLFAGSGREDALRFSAIGEELSRPATAQAIRETLVPRMAPRTFQGWPPPKMRDV